MTPIQPLLDLRIEYLEFSTRVINALRTINVETLGDLIQLQERELFKCPNLGRRAVNEIRVELESRGLTLGLVLSPPLADQVKGTCSAASTSAEQSIADCRKARAPQLEHLARDGCASADVHLGRFYLEGVGVERDYRKARYHFIRAARKGNRLGLWNLALIYRVGYGVSKSNVKAERFHRGYANYEMV